MTGCIVDRFLVIFVAVSGNEVPIIGLEAEIIEALCIVVSFVDSVKVVFSEWFSVLFMKETGCFVDWNAEKLVTVL